MKNTKTKVLIVALVTAFQSILIGSAFAVYLPVRAYGMDTVAGYASKLKTSLVSPNQNLTFVVEKPDGAVVKVTATADLEGVAQADLYGHQTKVAGTYKMAVVFPGSPDASPQTIFSVYPDVLSGTQSTIQATSQMVTADGNEKTFVTVTLFDAYRNAITNHQVQLISSRKEDEVSSINNGVTDEQGRANFKVTSRYPGVSTFTALDSTVSQVLADREEVVFFAPTPKENSNSLFAADIFAANIGQADPEVLPGPVDRFEIQDLPSQVKVNTDQTMTVVALDKNGNVAKNYTGTILLSTPDDEHSTLPNNGEYTFKENDQGRFTFNLALSFSQLGKQTVQVLDKTNWKIAGEKEVEVVSSDSVSQQSISGTLSIKSPVNGAELGNSLVVISGQGEANINLRVFDNDMKIGDAETDADGFFSFQAQNLLSGSHMFYVMSDKGDVSSQINVTIDTLPPVLNYFEVSPEGTVAPGTSLTITVQSEPNLEEVKARLQGAEEMLPPSASQPGTYTATIAAPVVEGSYPIDIILVDRLANKAEMAAKGMVAVSAPKPVAPPKVEGLEGVPGDKQVTLTWQPVTVSDNIIQNYRVYFGTTFDKLDQKLDTVGAVTSAVVQNLENDKQYFFAIRAVDSKGMESEETSVTVAVTPVAPQVESTPVEVTTNATPSTLGGIQGTALPNAVALTWQPFTQTGVYFYKVYFGLQAGQYDDYVMTPAPQGFQSPIGLTIQDLINGVPYHFSVVALDDMGKEISPLSAEFVLAPGGAAASYHSTAPAETQGIYPAPSYGTQLTHVPATEKTGPEAVWIVVLSLVAAHFFYYHKRRLIKR